MAPPRLEQRIEFSELDGRRIAWSTVGSGPPLVIPSPWVGHLQGEWENEEHRQFIERLAQAHTVVRYDRPGTGLSDRRLPDRPGLEHDVRTLEALVAELGLGQVSLFGVSAGSCIALGFAARNPEATTAMVFAGGYVDGAKLASAPVQRSLTDVIRANWGLGARVLSDLFVPGGTEDERAAWTRFQREAADPESAADLYAQVYAYDAGWAVERATAPALVLHRRDDRAVAFENGRDLAARLPNARFVPLPGTRHLPWQPDAEPVLAETLAFLAEHGGDDAPVPAPVVDLSPREIEVLRLVADGRSDREIADRLVLSPHTVHRHVANIRTKLGQPSRAAAAAYATRHQLI